MIEARPARHSRILGIGGFLPPRVVTNHELAQRMDTSHDWIVERTGIHERRWAEEGTACSDLALPAARGALEQAGVAPAQVELIVFATTTPDHDFPGAGVFLQRKLGLAGVPALDIRQQCTGFVHGLAIADAFIRAGVHSTVLVVGAEVQSCALDVSTRGRDMAVLFGDGAGAAVVGVGDETGRRILSTHLHADGAEAEILWMEKPGSACRPRISAGDIEAGRHYPRMEGRKVFKHASTRMAEVLREALAANGLAASDLDLLIPHQANLRIIESVGHQLGLAPEKIHNNIRTTGNTTAASIPLCLCDAQQAGRLRPGMLVGLVAFGAGLTWGAALLRW
ncbi:MAG: beta-ketoacyl-ACP synthase III [Kiritimatiellia bacterium]